MAQKLSNQPYRGTTDLIDQELKIRQYIFLFWRQTCLSFGFQEPADFRVSDIRSNGGTNFKVNYQGTVIPFWLKESLLREEIYSTVCAALVATIFGLNLVEISQALKKN